MCPTETVDNFYLSLEYVTMIYSKGTGCGLEWCSNDILYSRMMMQWVQLVPKKYLTSRYSSTLKRKLSVVDATVLYVLDSSLQSLEMSVKAHV